MLSLKALKAMEAQPTLFDTPTIEEISNEDAYEVEGDEPATDWYIPKKSWKQFFAEREAGVIGKGWEIPVFDKELPKEVRLDACTVITDVKRFVESHIAILKKYNGNKRFEPYLKRLNDLKSIIHA